MDKEYLENLIFCFDKEFTKDKDVYSLISSYIQLRIRLINHLELDLPEFDPESEANGDK